MRKQYALAKVPEDAVEPWIGHGIKEKHAQRRVDLVRSRLFPGEQLLAVFGCTSLRSNIALGAITRVWERALRKAGVRHVSFHSLRHTAVSLLIAHEHLNRSSSNR